MNKFIYKILFLLILILWPNSFSQALEPGTLLYRTTDNGKMYGYSGDPLLETKNGILTGINPGHVGIYVGEENGEHFVVEVLAGGIIKTPARYFINENLKEEFIGAKLPREADIVDRLKAVKIAKSLVGLNLGYDFDFYKQKGPGSGDWTCVGLVEKIYESINKLNPHDWINLEYNSDNYGIDITPDGFDNFSIINDEGDCFSKELEFSKISRRQDIFLPLPEIIGFNAGLEYKGERYIFFPYTQFIQPTLKDVPLDIVISSNFEPKKIRGKAPVAKLLLRWSLINNPVSTVKNLTNKISSLFQKTTNFVVGNKDDNNLVLTEFNNQDINDKFSDNQLSLPTVKINKIDDNSAKQTTSPVSPTSEVEVVTNTHSLNAPVKIATLEEDKEPVNINNSITKNVDHLSENASNNLNHILKPESIVKITSSSKNLNNETTNQASSFVDNTKIEYNPNQNNASKIISGLVPIISSANNNNNDNLNQNPISINPVALISKIYATDNNDFIELYNPLDYDFDLAEASFRLEKSKTAEDPSLMMRIGNVKDGFYPGGTVIKSKDYYLIVREDASDYYLSRADAIANRSEFRWTDSGYIIYLGKGAISSSSDEDILDAVGFGAAKYFQGSNPAPVILDNYFLDRISNLNDNSLDFKLSAIADPDASWDDNTNLNNDNDNNNNENPMPTNPPDEDDDENPMPTNPPDEDDSDNHNDYESDDFMAYVSPEPFLSSGMSYLKNFSECYGEHTYSVGRFDCSLEVGRRYQDLLIPLAEEVDINQFSLGFFYRDSKHFTDSPNLTLVLKNDTGQELNLELHQSMLQIEGLPNSAWRYHEANLMPDQNWHHFLLSVNKDSGYWAVYIDGVEKYRHSFIETLADNLYILELKGEIGSVSVDELAIWNKSLSILEINEYFSAQAPLSPAFVRLPQAPAELKYFWDFNEGHTFVNEGGGQIAIDKINGLTFNLPNNSWVWRGEENTGIINRWGDNLEIDFSTPLARQDLSLSFWWRSRFHPNEGRSLILLKNGDSHNLGLVPSYGKRGFFFNDQYGIFSEGSNVDLPHDENWHHFAITYDSYRYLLKLYIDGEEKKQFPFIWIKENNLPSSLSIQSQLNSVELDDLAIWEGTLTAGQVRKIFEDTLVIGN